MKITVGHPAVLIGSDEKGWDYFSYHAGNWAKYGDNLETGHYDTLEQAFESEDLKGYDEFAYWKRNKEQIEKARAKATEWDTNVVGYFIAGQNCEDIVGEAARAAGINWQDRARPYKSWRENKPKADICGQIERKGKVK